MPVLLTFLIFTYFFIKFLRGDTGLKTMIPLCISSILCLYAHQYALVPMTIACILALYYNGRKIWKYALVTLAITVPAIYYNRNYIPAIFYNYPREYNNPFWVSWDKIAIMLPSELFGMMWIIIFFLFIYSLYKKHNAVSISFATIGILTMISCLPMTLVLAMSSRYVLLVSPMILLVALDPISDFIDGYIEDSKKIALTIAALFIFEAFTWFSWISWTTFNICRLWNGGI